MMSKLLDEALKKYEQWKECELPYAPPRNKYSYEEACQSMYYDGCNNTYGQMIHLIKKYEQPELTEEQEDLFHKIMGGCIWMHKDTIRQIKIISLMR